MATDLQRRVRREQVARAIKQRDVLQLAQAGGTDEEIAEALSKRYKEQGKAPITKSAVTTIRRRIMDQLASQRDRAAEDVVNMEVSRLDELLKSIWPRATQTWVRNPEGQLVPNPHQLKAQDRVIKIMERRAKLLGLDAPEKRSGDTTNVFLFGTPGEVEKEQQLWLESGGDTGVIEATDVVELGQDGQVIGA